MAVQSIGASVSGTGLGQPPDPAKKDIGEQEFLKLLMTQLGNQDPLNPMESAEFMDQLSAMNTVEQLMDANQRLENLMLGLTSLNNQTSVGLVGKTIVARGDLVQHTEGETTELKFEVAEPVAEANITIKDENGIVVDVIQLTDIQTGIQAVEWDGLDEEGLIESGNYTFEVRAQNEFGDPVEAATYVTGIVDEVRFDNGYPMLVIGGQEVGLEAILRIVNTSEEIPAIPSEEGDPSGDLDSEPASPEAEALAQNYAEDTFGN